MLLESQLVTSLSETWTFQLFVGVPAHFTVAATRSLCNVSSLQYKDNKRINNKLIITDNVYTDISKYLKDQQPACSVLFQVFCCGKYCCLHAHLLHDDAGELELENDLKTNIVK